MNLAGSLFPFPVDPLCARPVYQFSGFSGDQKEVTSVCKQYVDILDVLVKDFVSWLATKAFSKKEMFMSDAPQLSREAERSAAPASINSLASMMVKILTVCFGSAGYSLPCSMSGGVVIDLPKVALPFMFKTAEVVLAVRVVVLGEAVEQSLLAPHGRNLNWSAAPTPRNL